MEEFVDVVADTADLNVNTCLVELKDGRCSFGDENRVHFDELMKYVDEIKTLSHKLVESYLRLGQIFCDIHDRKLYRFVRRKSEEYPDLFSFAFKVFGYRKSTVYNLMNVYRNCTHADGVLKVTPSYEGFNYSVLVELSSLSYSEVRVIRPGITVSEVRELKRLWTKFGFVSDKLWSEQLINLRAKEAAELSAEKQKKKKDKPQGLLSLLSEADGTSSITVPSLQPDEQFELASETQDKLSGVPEPAEVICATAVKKRLEFLNDKERKEFISAEKCKTWELYCVVPQLGLKYYRYEFANGDSLIAEFGNYYEPYSDTPDKPFEYFRLHLQTKDRPRFDCRGIAPTYVIEYMKKFKDEI